jgi:hypothetical protein
MSNKNYITLRWLCIVGITTIILALITQKTESFWTFVAVMIGAFIVAVGAAYKFIQLLRKINWVSIWHYPTRIREKRQDKKTRLEKERQWQINRPKWTISEPVIDPTPINPKNNPPFYKGKFTISIRNRCPSQPPLNVSFLSVGMKLSQDFGRSKLSMTFSIEPRLQNIEIQPEEQDEKAIDMTGYPEGGKLYLDLGKCYHWSIGGVKLSLEGLGEEECYKEGYTNAQEISV